MNDDEQRRNAARNELQARSQARRQRIVAHVSHSFSEADAWDLAYWQSVGPEVRLSALVALLRDLEKVVAARGDADGNDT